MVRLDTGGAVFSLRASIEKDCCANKILQLWRIVVSMYNSIVSNLMTQMEG